MLKMNYVESFSAALAAISCFWIGEIYGWQTGFCALLYWVSLPARRD